jgi:hypothetical protein
LVRHHLLFQISRLSLLIGQLSISNIKPKKQARQYTQQLHDNLPLDFLSTNDIKDSIFLADSAVKAEGRTTTTITPPLIPTTTNLQPANYKQSRMPLVSFVTF